MDPWLERRGIWEQVHTQLIVSICRFLIPLLRPRYNVGIEERTYLAILPEESAGIPDVVVAARSRESDGRAESASRPSAARAEPMVGLRDPVPTFPIPLRPGDVEPELPLNQLLHEVYDLGGYDLVIDYGAQPEPPLSEADVAWASSFLSTSV
jgi:hypothetical protein